MISHRFPLKIENRLNSYVMKNVLCSTIRKVLRTEGFPNIKIRNSLHPLSNCQLEKKCEKTPLFICNGHMNGS